jgi:two-component system chemotaxis response regulator CheB
MPSATRVVIVSRQADFCVALRLALTVFPGVEMIMDVTSPDEALNKLSRTTNNIVIVDLDTVTTDAFALQRVSNRYSGVFIVLTAYSEAKAALLMRSGIREFAQKPPVINNTTISRYFTLIHDRSRGLVSERRIDYKDVAKSVTVNSGKKIIAIASSTGGTDALEKIIGRLPLDVPPILVVQHMPSGFTKMFATRLNGIYKIHIKEAQTGDFLLQGQLLLAPAGNHMKLVSQQGRLAVDCFLGTKMHGVMPAADVLFESVAEICRANAVGVVLTGMGADGARGLLLMHNNGARTIIQDQDTCVVYGMPKVAKDLGAADFELPITAIADKILALV